MSEWSLLGDISEKKLNELKAKYTVELSDKSNYWIVSDAKDKKIVKFLPFRLAPTEAAALEIFNEIMISAYSFMEKERNNILKEVSDYQFRRGEISAINNVRQALELDLIEEDQEQPLTTQEKYNA